MKSKFYINISKKMQYEKKYYGNGQGNYDDADFVLQPNQWVNLENLRVGSTDNGVVGAVESVGSNVLLSPIQPSVTYVTIGSVVDEERQRILYFNRGLVGNADSIMCYDVASGMFYTVLLSSQVIGGLNFDTNAVIHSAKVINGLLYWPNSTTNDPRKIDIDSGIKMNHPSFDTDAVPYVAPIHWSELTIIKRPPSLAPDITKETDSGFANNFIANDSFMFAYQYIYYNNETSVVGTYSNATRLNKVTDTFNVVRVVMDSLQLIPQTVRVVNLIVRVGSTAFIIKTWDKDVGSEATDIANQNSGAGQLTYFFYNNVTGPGISSDVILKPFDSVPIYSESLEVAKNRLFLANNTEGYDTPTDTSLAYSLNTVTLSGTSTSVNILEVELSRLVTPVTRYKSYYFYLDMVSPIGYYAYTSSEAYCTPCVSYPVLPPPPTTLTMADLTFRGTSLSEIIASVNAAYALTLGGGNIYYSIYWATLTGISTTTYDIFKTQTQYKIGVVFYDYAMRKCGVVTKPFSSSTSDPTLVTTPARNFALSTAVNGITWTLSNTNALTEIPEWAFYYCVVRTLNLRTRYFLQAVQQDSDAKYVTRDADGNYEFTNTTFLSSAVGIGLDTTSLTQAGLGYVFSEGDVCYLIKEDNTAYTLSVIGQSGKYIIVNVPEGGIGDLATFMLIYELYTPYKASEQEPFFEVGEMYRIQDPLSSLRQYVTLTGTFLPDTYALTRNYDSITYFAETMSPNDRFYSRWDNDGGKVNFIVKGGQTSKPQNISYSNVFIPGTATNGLSTFEALNEKPVPMENGPIRKLQLTSKTQDLGDVMLAICENETSSVYLGETSIVDNTGTSQFFAASLDVISTIYNLKGSFGTVNPESVIEFRGNVYWVDLLNGKVIQYSLNGLFPISNYKMTRYWKLFCDQYLSMSSVAIEALGSRPFIFTTVDPHHWELLITVPRVLENPPMGYLPDAPYADYVYPFDIWDGQAKTLVFKINAEPNFWQGSYNWTQEGYVTIQNKLYSFKYGQLYEHNSTDSYCNFNGIQYKSRLMGICNQQPERVKVYNNISVQANMLPTLTYFMSLSPYTQVSNLQDFDYETKEGVYYCQIYRNVLTPTATGLKSNALVTGEKMRTYAFRFMTEFTVSSIPVELRFINIGYQLSLGHSIPTQ
jgi:hypothetical protein